MENIIPITPEADSVRNSANIIIIIFGIDSILLLYQMSFTTNTQIPKIK